MNRILCNAFSLQMLEGDKVVSFKTISAQQASQLLLYGFTSAVGHADTAKIIGDQLGVVVQPNRTSVTMDSNTELIIAQYIGPRLPEGATELPEGAVIKYIKAKLVPEVS